MWHVVGGFGDGILVRKGPNCEAALFDEKLGTYAQIWEEEFQDGRLRYTKVAGDGPQHGWVLVGLLEKQLLVKTEETSNGRWNRIDFARCRTLQAEERHGYALPRDMVFTDEVIAARLHVDDNDNNEENSALAISPQKTCNQHADAFESIATPQGSPSRANTFADPVEGRGFTKFEACKRIARPAFERLKGTPLASHKQLAIELEYNALSRMQFESGPGHMQGKSYGDQECEADNNGFFIGDVQDIEDVPVMHRKKRKSLSNWYHEESEADDIEVEKQENVQRQLLLSPPETPAKENDGNQMLFTPLQSEGGEIEMKSSPSSSMVPVKLWPHVKHGGA